jgi:hypothetical protein
MTQIVFGYSNLVKIQIEGLEFQYTNKNNRYDKNLSKGSDNPHQMMKIQKKQKRASSSKNISKSVSCNSSLICRINNRKFDFRCYILITTVNGFLKGYWYGNGYIRTSSEEYDLNDIQNRMIHLTNDAVQSKNSTFGKF